MANLVCDEESFDFPGNVPMFMENDRLLSDFVSRNTRIIHTYDFGDGWEHEITIEDLDEAYPKNYPVCLDGDGTRPPEDVGGEGGYEDYLEIMADPGHPEHNEMVEWSSGQFREDFNLDQVNARLKNSL